MSCGKITFGKGGFCYNAFVRKQVISGEANKDFYKKDYLDSEDVYINLVAVSARIASHAHDFIEITFVADGTGIHTLDG
jgi:hypothetical protein